MSERSSSSPPTTARGCATATTPARRGRCAGGRPPDLTGGGAGRWGPRGGGKTRNLGGGGREPFVARWPGHIAAGRETAEPVMSIDLLPTFAKLAGATLATDRIIDGKDIWPLLAGEAGAKSPHESLYFYWGTELHAVRAGKWK